MEHAKKGKYAASYRNDSFYCIETLSGYGGGMRTDYKGIMRLLPLTATDQELGLAVIDAKNQTRYVASAPRSDLCLPDDLEYDKDLYDFNHTAARYEAWIQNLMQCYGYKTRKKLFMYMHNCSIDDDFEIIKITPMMHEKLELWTGIDKEGSQAVKLPSSSSAQEIGAALKLAFSRCQ
jgi:hypothetical protein